MKEPITAVPFGSWRVIPPLTSSHPLQASLQVLEQNASSAVDTVRCYAWREEERESGDNAQSEPLA